MKNELIAYTRTGAQQTAMLPRLVLAGKNRIELLENLCLLLLCRICFAWNLFSPFGIAYFASLFLKKRRISYCVCAGLGVISTGFVPFSLKYGGTLLIIGIVFSFFQKELTAKKLMPALLSSAALLLNGMIYVISEGFFAYDMLMLLAETAAAFLTYLILDRGVLAIQTYEKRTMFEPVEIMGVVCLLSVTVLSVALIENMLPVAQVLAISAVLAISLSGGFTVSCGAGTVFGLCLGLAGNYPAQTVCIYCISSLASGAAKRYGKIGVTVAFALCAFGSVMLLCPETNGVITVSYVALAGILLLFVPDRLLARFGSLTAVKHKERGEQARIRELVTQTVSDTIASIDSVSRVFHDVLSTLPAQNDASHSVMFDRVADTVCSKCTLCKFCWQKNRLQTLSQMNTMFSTLERKNALTKSDMPGDFVEMCIRRDAFLTELNKHYEAYKITRMWAGRVSESKRLVAEQFENISMILKNMQTGLQDRMQCEPELEQKIYAALDRKGLFCSNICVTGGDGFTVTMDKVSCGESLVCSTQISAAISEVLEVPMLRENRVCSGDICHLTFSQQTRFVTDIAVSSATCMGSVGSGDSAMYFPCGGGRIACVLSDGCGSGEKAQFQSSVTVNLTKNLLTAGFDKETCVRLINNILMVNADRDTFATLDLCIVNLYTGTMEFVKTGAANSYIKTENTPETVYASSLPVGLVQAISPDYDLRYMKAGDFLIMASDGVTDVLDTPDNNEIFVLSADFSGTAQALADRILNAALEKSGGCPADDLTVMVCAVSENM